MFMGEYQHSIDSKGRVSIPAKFREELGERFVTTKGLDKSLFVYPMEEWQRLSQKLRSLPFTRADARAFARFFFSGAIECELDKQGRVLLPQLLREHAKINKDVIIIGVSTRVEIWAKEVWEEYSLQAASDYEDIAEKMVDLDL
ncbi:MAG: division/cell wall cluster transcriptional repressor MraZ [Clostridia bacterium]|jgi:MraZ protein|nr:division/cell wall cluster transcriptional repressor MraZ [Clostridia bacterium]